MSETDSKKTYYCIQSKNVKLSINLVTITIAAAVKVFWPRSRRMCVWQQRKPIRCPENYDHITRTKTDILWTFLFKGEHWSCSSYLLQATLYKYSDQIVYSMKIESSGFSLLKSIMIFFSKLKFEVQSPSGDVFTWYNTHWVSIWSLWLSLFKKDKRFSSYYCRYIVLLLLMCPIY